MRSASCTWAFCAALVAAVGCSERPSQAPAQPIGPAGSNAPAAGTLAAAGTGAAAGSGSAGMSVSGAGRAATVSPTMPVDAGAVVQPSDAGKPPLPNDAGASDDDAGSAPPSDAGTIMPPPDAAVPPSMLPVLETHGQPLTAPRLAWTYIEFPDTKCRDGSAAGISVSLNPASKNLLLYLEGGGACFDATTCSVASSANIDGTNLTLSAPGTGANINSARKALTEGIFDRDNAENPIRDWNIVYVPYCTGDTHGGANDAPIDVPGPSSLLGAAPRRQWFVGRNNLLKFLDRVAPTFKDAQDVLLAGVSAGGYGVLQNLYLVQRAFPNVKVKHVNDSAPAFSTKISPECMQKKVRTLWGLEKGFLAECGSHCPNQDDYAQANILWLAQLLSDRPSGFIENTKDAVISQFQGTGVNDCTGQFLTDTPDLDVYKADVLGFADKLKAFPNYGTFIIEGTTHTYLRTNNFYTQRTGGVRLVDWFAKIIKGEAPGHLGP